MRHGRMFLSPICPILFLSGMRDAVSHFDQCGQYAWTSSFLRHFCVSYHLYKYACFSCWTSVLSLTVTGLYAVLCYPVFYSNLCALYVQYFIAYCALHAALCLVVLMWCTLYVVIICCNLGYTDLCIELYRTVPNRSISYHYVLCCAVVFEVCCVRVMLFTALRFLLGAVLGSPVHCYLLSNLCCALCGVGLVHTRLDCMHSRMRPIPQSASSILRFSSLANFFVPVLFY